MARGGYDLQNLEGFLDIIVHPEPYIPGNFIYRNQNIKEKFNYIT